MMQGSPLGGKNFKDSFHGYVIFLNGKSTRKFRANVPKSTGTAEDLSPGGVF